jgi:hypothetical protein
MMPDLAVFFKAFNLTIHDDMTKNSPGVVLQVGLSCLLRVCTDEFFGQQNLSTYLSTLCCVIFGVFPFFYRIPSPTSTSSEASSRTRSGAAWTSSASVSGSLGGPPCLCRR